MRLLYEQRCQRAERIIEARSRRQSAAQVVVGGERPRLPVAWSDDVKELLAVSWRGDPQERCSAGHAAGVLTRLEVSGGPDPLAANMACCVIA